MHVKVAGIPGRCDLDPPGVLDIITRGCSPCEAYHHPQIDAALAISFCLEPIPSSDPSLFWNLRQKPNTNFLPLMRIGDCNTNVTFNLKIVTRTGTGSVKS